MYLVTEGNDLLSSHIIVQLLRAGHRVRTTVPHLHQTTENQLKSLCQEAEENLDVVEINLEEGKSLERCLLGVSGVFFNSLAVSACSLSSPDEARLIHENVSAVCNTLTACAQAGCVTRVVFTSSLSTITRGNESKNTNKPLSEADWANQSCDRLGTFARVSIARENACWDFIGSFKGKPPFELISMNPGILVGPLLSASNHTSHDIIASYLKGEKVCARISFSFVDVRDAAAAHLTAMTSSKIQGGRILLHGECLWLSDVVELIKRHFQPLGYKISACTIPNGLLKFAGLFSKDAKIICDMLDKTVNLDNSKMTGELGVSASSIEDAIIEMGHSLIQYNIVPTAELYQPKAVEGPPAYDQLYPKLIPYLTESKQNSCEQVSC